MQPCIMGTLLVSTVTFLSLWLKYKGNISGYHGNALSHTNKKKTPRRLFKKGETLGGRLGRSMNCHVSNTR